MHFEPIEITSKLDALACELAFLEHAPHLGASPLSRKKTARSIFHARNLLDLEIFIEKIQKNDNFPALLPRGSTDYCPNFISTLGKITGFIETIRHLSPRFEYSEYIELFRNCCLDTGIRLPPSADWQQRWKETEFFPGLNRPSTYVINDLIDSIRSKCREVYFVRKVRNRRRECARRFKEYCIYVEALFAIHARLVVVRVDLFYQKALAPSVDLRQATDDLNHLLNNRRSNQIFDDLRGYIAKAEYGIEKGIHFHTILFFDGSTRKGSSHIYLAQLIGEYWVEVVTKGNGDYWNSNARASEFDRKGLLGIGPIHASSDQLRFNLNRIVRYLTKSDQFVRHKCDHKFRLLRRGNMPKIDPIKRGRPRNVKEDSCNAIAETIA